MIAIISLLAGLVLLCLGAEAAIRGAQSLGLRLGLSTLVVGLTVVAYGTSAPELFVSVEATRAGHDEIALGNVVGSNIANILLILGLCALLRPIEINPRMARIEAPLLFGISLLAAILVQAQQLGRLAGLLLVSGLIAYTIWVVRSARRELRDPHEQAQRAEPSGASSPTVTYLLIGVGGAFLIGGGNLFVNGASSVAASLGVPPAVVGLTLVAIGTSLPELATSVAAALRGETDLAIANVIGSNLFNLLGVLGISAFIDPIGEGGARLTDLLTMLASSGILLALLYTGKRIERWHGALLLVGYGAYVSLLLR